MFVLIFILVGLLVVLIFWVKHYLFVSNILWNFKHCNVIVAGKKGSGKDLLFQYVIYKRNDFYYANLPYGGDTETIEIKGVSVEPNTYERIVNGEITKIPHRFYEGKDIYISDIGIYLPSYMDNKLYVKFPSMPILYALSRQLYNNNIHCNTQNIERGWKALREQADFYCVCKRTYKLPFFLIITVVSYDKYESAKQNLMPIKTRLINKYSKAQVDLYNAQNGDIQKGHIIVRKSKIKYDTRYFEKVLLHGARLVYSKEYLQDYLK